MSAKSFALGAGTAIVVGTATGVLLEHYRAHLRKKEEERTEIGVGIEGPDDYVPVGTYAAHVPTSAYVAQKTPLDDVLRSGLVKLVEASNYDGASKMWIKVRVPSSWHHPTLARAFREWADWQSTPDSVTAEQAIAPDDREGALVRITDAVDQQARELGSVIADAVVAPAKRALGTALIAGGFALGILFALRSRK